MTAAASARLTGSESAGLIVHTIGHSTHAIGEFIALLSSASVERVVDVRALPRSRTNPQFNTEVLCDSLATAAVKYLHLPALGGRRGRQRTASRANLLWRNQAFRNFADYALSDAFLVGLEELKALAASERCAIMCAEALWWRCHRRIIADYLIADGIAVAHIMGPGKIEPGTLTPGARTLPDGRLSYEIS